MQDHERNYFVANIVAGQYRISVSDQHFVIRTPSLISQADSEAIFKDSYNQAAIAGALTEDEIKNVLAENGIYNEDNEATLKKIELGIEDQKVALYENATRSSIRSTIREALSIAKKEHNKLLILKHSYDHLGCHGIAQMAKLRYLFGCSVYYENGRPYWEEPRIGWMSSDRTIDFLMMRARAFHLDEQQFRELARTNPWRSIWESAKYCGGKIFDCSSSQLSGDQRTLVSWSSMYDSIREHPACPSDDIIEDDDMIDGWMIIRRKERLANMDKKMGEELITNPKIKNSQEVFVVADKKDISKVLNLNSEESRMIMASRLNTIKRVGEVKEADMPDTAFKNQQAIMNAFAQANKGK